MIARCTVQFPGCAANASHLNEGMRFTTGGSRLETERVFPLTLVVDYSSAANSQFGPRRHESNPGHNEENLQYEQKKVHDSSPVFAPKTNATIMIGATGDLFPRLVPQIMFPNSDLEVKW